MPESPKKIATSPASPTFAEQCIGKAPKSGSRSFIAREDRLLDLAGVGGAADQDLALRRMERDERARAGAVLGRVGLERRGMQHHAFRREAFELGLLGAMNIVPAKSAWNGLGVTTRTAMRYAGSAPA